MKFRPAILLGVRLDVEAHADRFSMKRPLRRPVEVKLADIRYVGVDRGLRQGGLAASTKELFIRTDAKLLRQPLDLNDGETMRFLAWLGAAVPAADVSSKPWPIAAQLLRVGAGLRLWSSPLFIIGVALAIGGLVLGAMYQVMPVRGSRAFTAGYRSAPFFVMVVGVVLAVVGWRRHKKRERADADAAKAERFD